ncbi:MAG: CoA transferase [Deltaproteobacteria bacterium]|nr:CoA transferase [Deltaproteobacteria bacterium]
MRHSSSSRTLAGIKILDLSRLLPGRFAVKLLSDLGASVDQVRGPGFEADFKGPGRIALQSFFSFVRYRKSYEFNLKEEKDRRRFCQLVQKTDLLIENFRPGVMDRLGVGYKVLSKKNRGLILCSITGYGQKGENSQRPGHDLNYLAASGLLDLFRDSRGKPIIPQIQIADLVGGGLYAVIEILAALRQRQKNGKGCHLDISMTRSLEDLVSPYRRSPKKALSLLTGKLARYNIYQTRGGGEIALGCLEPKFWKRWCEKIGHPEWASAAERFDFIGTKRYRALQRMIRSRTKAQWLRIFRGNDVCVSPVVTL